MKYCADCVYSELVKDEYVCIGGRHNQRDIKDCFIDVVPLRQAQRKAKTGEEYAYQTHKYILDAKRKSAYWKKFLKEVDKL